MSIKITCDQCGKQLDYKCLDIVKRIFKIPSWVFVNTNDYCSEECMIKYCKANNTI